MIQVIENVITEYRELKLGGYPVTKNVPSQVSFGSVFWLENIQLSSITVSGESFYSDYSRVEFSFHIG